MGNIGMNRLKNVEFYKWDIWYADVAFEDMPNESKIRPVLIIDSNKPIILTLKMFSHKPFSKSQENMYLIQDWQKAGLSNPTVINVKSPVFLDLKFFKKKIGVLQAKDRKSVVKFLSKLNI